MKYVVVLLLLFAPAFALAKDKSDADYPITLHVTSSRFDRGPEGSCCYVQHLFVALDGKKYELSDEKVRKDLLHIGDYKAKIAKDEQDHPFEFKREYEILLPSGETRTFLVIGESE
jgi:hypothetical protein